MIAALTSLMLAGFSSSTAGAQSACGALGGTVGPDRTCHAHIENDTYTVDFRFPVDCPDQGDDRRADTTAGRLHRLDHKDAEHVSPELDGIGHDYRSGAMSSGTQSLVLTIGTSAGVHPVTTYRSLNYDLSKHAPITFDTLFRPGAQPTAVLNPIVQRELDRHGATGALTLEDLGAKAYENFAITDDAVIFFFDQDGLLPHERGSLTVEVPRTELASLLA
jgi:hypothetical protein